MDNAQLINQDSGDYEYYTPPEIIEAARKVMGSIDIDPASSEEANKIVCASMYWGIGDDGLIKPWVGNVFLNHPFSRKNNPLWIKKAVKEYMESRAHQLICITFAATSEAWFQPLTEFRQCYLVPRTNYYKPDGTKKRGVTKGSVVTYMGNHEAIFEGVFEGMGWFNG